MMNINLKTISALSMALVLFTTTAMAQNNNKNQEAKSPKENIIKVSQDSLDFLHGEISRLDSLLKARESELTSIESDKDSLQLLISQLDVSSFEQQIASRDSLLQVKDGEIAVLKEREGFVDTCMVSLANRWLYEKYDRQTIQKAKTYFDRIYSTRYKNQWAIVQELVNCYETSYLELQKILHEAQSDDMRTRMAFLLMPDSYKDKYLKKIKDMSYYKKYYHTEWNILYMDELIDFAVESIKNHCKDKPADFSLVLDSIVLEDASHE